MLEHFDLNFPVLAFPPRDVSPGIVTNREKNGKEGVVTLIRPILLSALLPRSRFTESVASKQCVERK